MATVTYYLQNAAPPYAPTTKRGAWDDAASTVAKGLGSQSGANTFTETLIGNVTANWDQLLVRFVSAPLGSDCNFSGTIDGVIGLIGATALNGYLHLHVFVLQGGDPSDTLRGTLWANYIDSDPLSNTAATGGEGFSGTMSDLIAYAGDTIVVEAGVRASAGATGDNSLLYYGASGSDLVDNQNCTVSPGWIRLAYTSLVGPFPTFIDLGA